MVLFLPDATEWVLQVAMLTVALTRATQHLLLTNGSGSVPWGTNRGGWGQWKDWPEAVTAKPGALIMRSLLYQALALLTAWFIPRHYSSPHEVAADFLGWLDHSRHVLSDVDGTAALQEAEFQPPSPPSARDIHQLYGATQELLWHGLSASPCSPWGELSPVPEPGALSVPAPPPPPPPGHVGEVCPNAADEEILRLRHSIRVLDVLVAHAL